MNRSSEYQKLGPKIKCWSIKNTSKSLVRKWTHVFFLSFGGGSFSNKSESELLKESVDQEFIGVEYRMSSSRLQTSHTKDLSAYGYVCISTKKIGCQFSTTILPPKKFHFSFKELIDINLPEMEKP